MARKHEAVNWLKQGLSPSEIAKEMGVTVSTIMGYLYNQVGEGAIRRSDILFTIDPNIRGLIESIIGKIESTYWYSIYKEAKEMGWKLDIQNLKIYLELRDARVALGDMYEYISDIEIGLHNLIKDILISEYSSKNWWRKGIPKDIRAKCAALREEDPEPASDAYAYTDFINLSKILQKQWNVFREFLPKNLSSNRRKFLSRLEKLNHIRNCVMHPVKNIEITDQDFFFVREFLTDFKLWQKMNNELDK
jgi:predicted transcriptional regulator